jgi:trigger factor
MELVDVKNIPTKYTTNAGDEIDSVLQAFTLVTAPNTADKAIKKVQNQVKIHGFRQGKAPRKVIENQVGKEALYSDVISENWNEFITKNNVLVASTNTLNNIQVNIDGSISFTVSTNTLAPVDLAMSDDYSIDVTEAVVNDVGQQLHNLRQSNIEFLVVDRKLQWGDIAKFSFDGKPVGADSVIPALCGKEITVVVGNHAIVIPEIEQGLVDMAVDETKTITCKLPENLAELLPNNKQAAAHAGTEVEFTVTLHEVKERKHPSDEELATKMGKASYKELYESLVEEQKLKRIKDENYLVEKLIEKLIEENETILSKEVTPVVLDHRLNMFLSQYQQQLLGMEKEAREKLIQNTSNRIAKGIYQDIVLCSLINRFENELDEVTDEQVKEKLKSANKNTSYWTAYQNCINDTLYKHLQSFITPLFDTNNEKYRKVVDAIPSTSDSIEDIIDGQEATADK